MDYSAKLNETKHLIDRKQHTLVVVLLGNLLENLYVDFYQALSVMTVPVNNGRLIRCWQAGGEWWMKSG